MITQNRLAAIANQDQRLPMPRRRNLQVARTLSCIAALLFSAASGRALGFRIADQDSAATARGNAFVATADSPSAIYYNPAGLIQLTNPIAYAGIYGISLGSHYTSPTGVKFDTKNKPKAVPHFYYAAPAGGIKDLAWGIGMYSPYGLGFEWPANPTFGPMQGQITHLTFAPAFAWKPFENLTFGGALNINYADAILQQNILLAAGNNRFEGDDTDIGFNVGILYQPHPKHSFGVNYRAPTSMNFTGTARNTGIAVGTSVATARIPFPRNMVFGWSYRPTPKWNLEFNADWTEWDQLTTVLFNQSAALGGTAAIPFNWQDSWFFEWGATRYFDSGWRVSGGYIFSENSVPDLNFHPLIPDSDRHIFSFGTGRTSGKWRWDAAYQLAWGPSRTVAASALVFPVAANPSGRYKFLSHALTFTIGHEF